MEMKNKGKIKVFKCLGYHDDKKIYDCSKSVSSRNGVKKRCWTCNKIYKSKKITNKYRGEGKERVYFDWLNLQG